MNGVEVFAADRLGSLSVKVFSLVPNRAKVSKNVPHEILNLRPTSNRP